MSSAPRERFRQAFGLRLAVWYAAVFVASSLALIVLTYLLLSAALRSYDREQVQTTFVEYAAAWLRGGEPGLAAAIRRNQAAGGYEPLLVRAVGRFGGVVFLNAPQEWQDVDVTELAPPHPGGQQRWSLLRGGRGGSLEILTARLADGTLFQVGKSTARREDLLRRFRIVLLIDFATLSIIGVTAGAAFTASAVQPLRALIRTVRQIMETGRMDARVPARPSGDALDELSALVNAMLDRIQSLIAGMRGALDNVAHDLRTPMMRLRSIAESGVQGPQDPAALRRALEDCLEESDRVVTMLNTLMDISEAETGTMRLQREPVNLADLVRETIEVYEDAAEHKGVDVSADRVEEVVAPVDRTRLRQVLANLVDNAVKYTPAGGAVSIALRQEGSDALLDVRDTGTGIGAEELPRIWERLYRADKSRSERGLGLGLSLVKAIVEAHHGRVGVTSTPGEGSVFTVRLPLDA